MLLSLSQRPNGEVLALDPLPLAILAAALLVAAVAPLVVRGVRPVAGLVLALVPLAISGVLLWLAPDMRDGEPLEAVIAWAPALGLELALRLDGLAILFGVLVAGTGALVCIYAGGYLRDHEHLGRFFGLLLLFAASMFGVVMAGNLLLLYVFWELTTISSWLLIGFEHKKVEARKAAWQALIVTSIGGLAMLAGFVLLGQSAGAYDVALLTERGQEIREAPLYLPILVLVLVGAVAKSALVPLHFWLPNAMEAPTPVSAYLHSATMVTLGVFLLARLSPVLADTEAWMWAVGTVGGVTAVVGAWLALIQSDLKRLLAYSTISALGMMTLALGIGGSHGVRAALAMLFAHALYKAAMFMVAGAIDHGAGSRDLTEVGGMWRAMPWTATASGLAMLSMVGLPPTLGFISEEALVEVAKGERPAAGWLALAAVLVSGTLYTASGFVAGLRPFLGRQRSPDEPHEPGWRLWLPPLTLGVLGVALAFLPEMLDRQLITPATEATAGHAPEEPLKLWHGVTPAFLLGVGMLLVGALLAVAWRPLRSGALRLGTLRQVGPDRIYQVSERGLQQLAAGVDRLLQHGYLPIYLLIVLVTVLGLAALPVLSAGPRLPYAETPIRASDVVLVLVTLGAALGAALMRSRLTVVACMSVAGFSVGLLFAVFGGPDLAITQVLVETLMTVMVVLLLPALPRFTELAGGWVRVRDAAVCLAVGALVTVLLLTAIAIESAGRSAEFFAANSESQAGGRNIVNTILVNFRAGDTLGEIAVLWVAALGVGVLLGGAAHHDRGKEGRGSLVLTISVRILLPLLMLFALFLLLKGHHSPGGGFAAGLVLTAALALHLFGSPRAAERELLRLRPRTLAAIGLALAAASGLPGLVRGGAFLEAAWLRGKLELLGGFHLGTPLLFDIGVCLVAAGAMFTLIRTLEEHSPWRS